MNLILRLALALYRMVLQLYPRSFRRTFGAEMEEIFRLALVDAARRGAGPLLGLLTREGVGVCTGALGEQLRLRSRRWLLAFVALALIIGRMPAMGLWIVYVLGPVLIVVMLATTKDAPQLRRRLGLVALVLSWPLLAFCGAMVVEGWRYGNYITRFPGELPPLVQFYVALMSLDLRRMEYGYLITAVSAAICACRLARAPYAASAPVLFALSNLAAAWLYFLNELFNPIGRYTGGPASQAELLILGYQAAVAELSVALILLASLLLFQALVPLPRPSDRSPGLPTVPTAPHPTV
ncbi:hypothetical protein SD80_012025 [Scytonema tolypothrichoides VB-61278]|nr:hypothetical protein SD80_012025 [Scytonema tolypothrichoides VB-61278]